MCAMRVIRGLVVPLILYFTNINLGEAQNKILPGVTLFSPAEDFGGRLVFIANTNPPLDLANRTEVLSSLYEIDLSSETLRRVHDCPGGEWLAASDDGSVFAVAHKPSDPYHSGTCENLYLFSESASCETNLSLSGGVGEFPIFFQGHVFIRYIVRSASEIREAQRVLDYDIAKGIAREIELPDAGNWQIESIGGKFGFVLYTDADEKSVVFEYHHAGSRIGSSGKIYSEGFYRYNLLTGSVQGAVDLSSAAVAHSCSRVKGWGDSISFSGNAYNGYALTVRCQGDGGLDARGGWRDVKTIRGNRPFMFDGECGLISVSPCRRFGLVVSMKTSSVLTGFKRSYSYFAVDLSNGVTSLLLKDETERKRLGSMSTVLWVGRVDNRGR
jgi:hypothetical protein